MKKPLVDISFELHHYLVEVVMQQCIRYRSRGIRMNIYVGLTRLARGGECRGMVSFGV